MATRVRIAFFSLVVLVLAWGVFARTWGLGDRAFWRDEAWVADVVTHSSWGQLLRQSDVPTPPLFAAAVKLFATVVSPPETGLRLFPVLCGIACLPLGYLTARTLRAPRTIALAGMALSASGLMLVIWSRELKQYSVEACLSVLLALLVFRVRRSSAGRGRRLLVVGVILVCLAGPWFGYGMVFPAAALLLVLFVTRPASGTRAGLIGMGIAFLAALCASVLLVLLLAAAGQGANQALTDYVGAWFINPASARQWLRAAGYAAITTTLTLVPLDWFPSAAWAGAPALAIWLLALIGLATWPRRGRLELAAWTLLPWLLMLLASVAHRYPFGVTRMMVVLIPPLLLAVAAGVVVVFRICSVLILGRGGPGMIGGLLATLVPTVYAVNVPLRHSYWVWHDFPSLLRTLEGQCEPGEAVFVTVNAVPCVRYYAGRAGDDFSYHPVAAGTLPVPGYDYEALNREMVRAAGPCCWVLTTSERDETRRMGLERALREAGYELQLEAQAPSEAWYGTAQLFVATRRGYGARY